jgi:hypothetical protein
MKALGEDSGLEMTINKIVEGSMPIEEANKLMESKLAESMKAIAAKRAETEKILEAKRAETKAKEAENYRAKMRERILSKENERRLNAIKDCIEYYRKFGFFKGVSTEEALLHMLDKAIKEDITNVFWEELTKDMDIKELDFCLLFFDEKRYFASSWLKGDGAFKEIIEGLAKISSGVFKPEKITEKWESDDGPIRIEFVHEGKKVVIEAEWQTKEWPDIEILKRINPLIASKGYAFVMVECPVTDGPGFMMLSTEEKRKLEKERGWKFLEKN